MSENQRLTGQIGPSLAAAAALVVLWLSAVAPATSWAQMDYKGALVPNSRDRSETYRIAPRTDARLITAAPRAAYSPDGDFCIGYPDFASSDLVADDSAARSDLRDGAEPYGVPTVLLPWNQPAFAGYEENAELPRNASVSDPVKYNLHATAIQTDSLRRQPETAMLIAHLPEYAELWVEGKRISLKGRTSYFESPPLTAGKQYSYSVRTAWIEKGRWVSQTRKVPIEAGLVQALYLRPAVAKK